MCVRVLLILYRLHLENRLLVIKVIKLNVLIRIDAQGRVSVSGHLCNIVPTVAMAGQRATGVKAGISEGLLNVTSIPGLNSC